MKKKKKKGNSCVGIIVHKPENLDLENLITEEWPVLKYVKSKNEDNGWTVSMSKNIEGLIPAMYYFVHVLLERQHSDIDALRCSFFKDYVQMFSRDIEPIRSKNDFSMIWHILSAIQVVKIQQKSRPNKYRASAMAYFFRLADSFLDTKIVEHTIEVTKKRADKYYHESDSQKKADFAMMDISALTTNKQHAHQYKMLYGIIFDSEGALQYIKSLLANQEITVKRYNTCLISINNILHSRIKITRSQVCHRYYTNVTWMPKELRQFIMDGNVESLVELDFGSFNAFAIHRVLDALSPNFDSNAGKIAFENELHLYKSLLEGGDFYMDFKEYFFPAEDLTRDQVKDIVLHRWFNSRTGSKNKFRKKILKHMPKITGIIDFIKEKDYKDFSNMLMRMESELVNDIIYSKFVELHPDAVMYTIFDSFLIERKHADELQAMMQEEGDRYFNIKCIVRRK